jgi:hypothetical protein
MPLYNYRPDPYLILPWWPVHLNINGLGNGYVKFKETEGDKGLRNAVQFYWNAKKVKLTLSATITYDTYTDDGIVRDTKSLTKSHLSYDPLAGFYGVSPSQTPEEEIPQPASSANCELGVVCGFDWRYPSPQSLLYDELMIMTCRFSDICYIESLNRWVCRVYITGDIRFRTRNSNQNIIGSGFSHVSILNATDPTSSDEPNTSPITLPDVFEGGNRLSYSLGSGDSGSVTGSIDVEYWQYDP